MLATATPEEFITAVLEREKECDKGGNAHNGLANRWNQLNYVLGLVAAVLGVLVGGAVVDLTPIGPFGTDAGKAIFSLIAALLAAVLSFLKPAAMMEKHKQAKDDLVAVKDKFNAFRLGKLPNAQPPYPQELLDQYTRLLDEKKAAESRAPLTG